MTPFVIWLDKSELDELLATIIKNDNKYHTETTIFNGDELVNYTQHILNQNNTLIELFKKIQPLNPIQEQNVRIAGIKQKCEHYKSKLNDMKAHCSVFGGKSPIDNKNELKCEECPVLKICEN